MVKFYGFFLLSIAYILFCARPGHPYIESDTAQITQQRLSSFSCSSSDNSDMNTWYFYSCVNLQLKAMGMSTMPSVIV